MVGGDRRAAVVTHEQTELVRLGSAARHAVGVDDAPPGRCSTSGEVVAGGATTWGPVTHRGDRLGVLGTRSGGPSAAPLGELAADLVEEYLEPGDVVLLHTDGIAEARALDGRVLGLEGFVEMLRAELEGPGPLAERLRRIRLDLLARDAWLADDATVLLVQHG